MTTTTPTSNTPTGPWGLLPPRKWRRGANVDVREADGSLTWGIWTYPGDDAETDATAIVTKGSGTELVRSVPHADLRLSLGGPGYPYGLRALLLLLGWKQSVLLPQWDCHWGRWVLSPATGTGLLDFLAGNHATPPTDENDPVRALGDELHRLWSLR